MPRRFLLPGALLAFACLALPVAADPTAPLPRPANLRSDILYTHKGEFVQVSPMRALTLNAHVEQFAYDPLGIEIAVAGSETSGDNTTQFVKTLDARNGHEISRLAVTAPTGEDYANFSLLGWSTSGKYLLLKRYSLDPKEPETARAEFLRWDLSASSPAPLVVRPEAALPANTEPDADGFDEGYISPDGRWIAFRQNYRALGSDGTPGRWQTLCSLYDPEHDTFRTLLLPLGASLYLWSDNTHLQFGHNGVRKEFDVVTGQVSPRLEVSAPAVSKQYPDLSLDTEQQTLRDGRNSGSHLKATVIWIRRTPFGVFPLGVAPAGLVPLPETSAFPWSDDPNPVWSPTGKQIAFAANGDLCVTDLSVAAGAMPHEKLALGMKLSCADEQALAQSDLKQIGLAMIQYSQDNDEKFPAAEGWIKTIYPFIKTMDVFEVDGHPAVYEQPADLALASMDSPATTEQAYIDLPCARVVLFCDGHVKVFKKQEPN